MSTSPRKAVHCTCLLLAGAAAQAAPPPHDLKPYLAQSKRYALHKPADWYVREEALDDSLRVIVASPNGASLVEFYWAVNPRGKPDALAFLSEFREMLGQTCAQPRFSEAFLSADSSKALATIDCLAGSQPVKGRYYFESAPYGLFAQGYLAPASTLNSARPLLLNIMASLALPGRKAAPPVQQSAAPEPAPAPLPELVPRRAPDGSLSLSVPSDWVFLAGGGKVVSGAPDGGAGFIFTSFSGNPMLPNASIAQGVIGSPYRPPPQALGLILGAFGHRNIRILSAAPDPSTNQQFQATIGRRADAQDLLARWSSAQGSECVGAFKIINALPSPTGLWFTIMSGIWGPERDFQRHLPLLETIAGSFGINDQYARRYIQSGLENLRRLQRQTAAAIQDLNRAREQNQADWEARQARKDYMDSKWDDYRRGNSYWVSDLEGGKVYRTDSGGTLDTSTGDYYSGKPYNWVNFEGQNPRHPSENMRELSSWEVEHGRRPPK